MAKNKGKAGRKDEVDREPIAVLVARFTITILVLLLIAHVSVFFALRTDGFKSFLEDKLSEDLGVKVEMGSTQATWMLNVVCEDVKGADSEAVFEFQKIVLTWSRMNIFARGKSVLDQVSLEGGWIRFVKSPNGILSPKTLGPLGTMLADAVGLTRHEPDQRLAVTPRSSRVGRWLESLRLGLPLTTKLTLADIRVDFGQGQRHVLDSLENLSLTVTPIALPNRYLSHVLLEVERVTSARGVRQHVRREFAHSDELEVVFEGGTEQPSAHPLMVQRASPFTPAEEQRDDPPVSVSDGSVDFVKESLQEALQTE